MAVTTVEDFRIGSVIGRGVSIFFGNIVAFAIVTVVLFIVPVLLTIFVFSSMGPELAGILSLLVWLIAYFWLSAALVYGVVSDLRGNKAGAGRILSGAFPVLIPVFLLSIVIGLMVGIGTLLLIVPGVILYVMFWVAVPAAVVERQGVMASLKRSLELTKGYRWKIFFILVIWAVLAWVIQVVLMVILGVPLEAAGMGAAGTSGASWILQIVNVLLSGISASILAVGYHDLRVVKEGIGSDEIARVFD
jgi:hypothetical protein